MYEVTRFVPFLRLRRFNIDYNKKSKSYETTNKIHFVNFTCQYLCAAFYIKCVKYSEKGYKLLI